MKKLAASILLLVYFAVSTGFVVSVHYCMDKVNAVELGDVSDDRCSNCGMTNNDSDGCCKDEVKVMKMQVDHVVAKILKASFSIPAIASFSTQFFFTPLISNVERSQPVAHGPPLSEQDTYLQICVFRI